MAASTMLDLRKYFNEGSTRVVTTAEFSAFWKSLSEDDKVSYKAQLDVIRGVSNG